MDSYTTVSWGDTCHIFTATSVYSQGRLMDQMFPLASKNSICFWFYISILSFWLPALPVCTSSCAIFWFCLCTSFLVVCQQLTNLLTHSSTAYISLQPEFPTFQQSGTWSQKFFYFFTLFLFSYSEQQVVALKILLLDYWSVPDEII